MPVYGADTDELARDFDPEGILFRIYLREGETFAGHVRMLSAGFCRLWVLVIRSFAILIGREFMWLMWRIHSFFQV
jgi:hypothetical protein